MALDFELAPHLRDRFRRRSREVGGPIRLSEHGPGQFSITGDVSGPWEGFLLTDDGRRLSGYAELLEGEEANVVTATGGVAGRGRRSGDGFMVYESGRRGDPMVDIRSTGSRMMGSVSGVLGHMTGSETLRAAGDIFDEQAKSAQDELPMGERLAREERGMFSPQSLGNVITGSLPFLAGFRALAVTGAAVGKAVGKAVPFVGKNAGKIGGAIANVGLNSSLVADEVRREMQRRGYSEREIDWAMTSAAFEAGVVSGITGWSLGGRAFGRNRALLEGGTEAVEESFQADALWRNLGDDYDYSVLDTAALGFAAGAGTSMLMDRTSPVVGRTPLEQGLTSYIGRPTRLQQFAHRVPGFRGMREPPSDTAPDAPEKELVEMLTTLGKWSGRVSEVKGMTDEEVRINFGRYFPESRFTPDDIKAAVMQMADEASGHLRQGPEALRKQMSQASAHVAALAESGDPDARSMVKEARGWARKNNQPHVSRAAKASMGIDDYTGAVGEMLDQAFVSPADELDDRRISRDMVSVFPGIMSDGDPAPHDADQALVRLHKNVGLPEIVGRARALMTAMRRVDADDPREGLDLLVNGERPLYSARRLSEYLGADADVAAGVAAVSGDTALASAGKAYSDAQRAAQLARQQAAEGIRTEPGAGDPKTVSKDRSKQLGDLEAGEAEVDAKFDAMWAEYDRVMGPAFARDGVGGKPSEGAKSARDAGRSVERAEREQMARGEIDRLASEVGSVENDVVIGDIDPRVRERVSKRIAERGEEERTKSEAEKKKKEEEAAKKEKEREAEKKRAEEEKKAKEKAAAEEKKAKEAAEKKARMERTAEAHRKRGIHQREAGFRRLNYADLVLRQAAEEAQGGVTATTKEDLGRMRKALDQSEAGVAAAEKELSELEPGELPASEPDDDMRALARQLKERMLLARPGWEKKRKGVRDERDQMLWERVFDQYDKQMADLDRVLGDEAGDITADKANVKRMQSELQDLREQLQRKKWELEEKRLTNLRRAAAGGTDVVWPGDDDAPGTTGGGPGTVSSLAGPASVTADGGPSDGTVSMAARDDDMNLPKKDVEEEAALGDEVSALEKRIAALEAELERAGAQPEEFVPSTELKKSGRNYRERFKRLAEQGDSMRQKTGTDKGLSREVRARRQALAGALVASARSGEKKLKEFGERHRPAAAAPKSPAAPAAGSPSGKAPGFGPGIAGSIPAPAAKKGDGERQVGPKMTRRQFLKTAGTAVAAAKMPVLGAGATLAGAATPSDWARVPEDEDGVPTNVWDEAFENVIDVVIPVENKKTGEIVFVSDSIWDPFQAGDPSAIKKFEEQLAEARAAAGLPREGEPISDEQFLEGLPDEPLRGDVQVSFTEESWESLKRLVSEAKERMSVHMPTKQFHADFLAGEFKEGRVYRLTREQADGLADAVMRAGSFLRDKHPDLLAYADRFSGSLTAIEGEVIDKVEDLIKTYPRQEGPDSPRNAQIATPVRHIVRFTQEQWEALKHWASETGADKRAYPTREINEGFPTREMFSFAMSGEYDPRNRFTLTDKQMTDFVVSLHGFESSEPGVINLKAALKQEMELGRPEVTVTDRSVSASYGHQTVDLRDSDWAVLKFAHDTARDAGNRVGRPQFDERVNMSLSRLDQDLEGDAAPRLPLYRMSRPQMMQFVAYIEHLGRAVEAAGEGGRPVGREEFVVRDALRELANKYRKRDGLTDAERAAVEAQQKKVAEQREAESKRLEDKRAEAGQSTDTSIADSVKSDISAREQEEQAKEAAKREAFIDLFNRPPVSLADIRAKVQRLIKLRSEQIVAGLDRRARALLGQKEGETTPEYLQEQIDKAKEELRPMEVRAQVVDLAGEWGVSGPTIPFDAAILEDVAAGLARTIKEVEAAEKSEQREALLKEMRQTHLAMRNRIKGGKDWTFKKVMTSLGRDEFDWDISDVFRQVRLYRADLMNQDFRTDERLEVVLVNAENMPVNWTQALYREGLLPEVGHAPITRTTTHELEMWLAMIQAKVSELEAFFAAQTGTHRRTALEDDLDRLRKVVTAIEEFLAHGPMLVPPRQRFFSDARPVGDSDIEAQERWEAMSQQEQHDWVRDYTAARLAWAQFRVDWGRAQKEDPGLERAETYLRDVRAAHTIMGLKLAYDDLSTKRGHRLVPAAFHRGVRDPHIPAGIFPAPSQGKAGKAPAAGAPPAADKIEKAEALERELLKLHGVGLTRKAMMDAARIKELIGQPAHQQKAVAKSWEEHQVEKMKEVRQKYGQTDDRFSDMHDLVEEVIPLDRAFLSELRNLLQTRQSLMDGAGGMAEAAAKSGKDVSALLAEYRRDTELLQEIIKGGKAHVGGLLDTLGIRPKPPVVDSPPTAGVGAVSPAFLGGAKKPSAAPAAPQTKWELIGESVDDPNLVDIMRSSDAGPLDSVDKALWERYKAGDESAAKELDEMFRKSEEARQKAADDKQKALRDKGIMTTREDWKIEDQDHKGQFGMRRTHARHVPTGVVVFGIPHHTWDAFSSQSPGDEQHDAAAREIFTMLQQARMKRKKGPATKGKGLQKHVRPVADPKKPGRKVVSVTKKKGSFRGVNVFTVYNALGFERGEPSDRALREQKKRVDNEGTTREGAPNRNFLLTMEEVAQVRAHLVARIDQAVKSINKDKYNRLTGPHEQELREALVELAYLDIAVRASHPEWERPEGIVPTFDQETGRRGPRLVHHGIGQQWRGTDEKVSAANKQLGKVVQVAQARLVRRLTKITDRIVSDKDWDLKQAVSEMENDQRELTEAQMMVEGLLAYQDVLVHGADPIIQSSTKGALELESRRAADDLHRVTSHLRRDESSDESAIYGPYMEDFGESLFFGSIGGSQARFLEVVGRMKDDVDKLVPVVGDNLHLARQRLKVGIDSMTAKVDDLVVEDIAPHAGFLLEGLDNSLGLVVFTARDGQVFISGENHSGDMRTQMPLPGVDAATLGEGRLTMTVKEFKELLAAAKGAKHGVSIESDVHGLRAMIDGKKHDFSRKQGDTEHLAGRQLRGTGRGEATTFRIKTTGGELAKLLQSVSDSMAEGNHRYYLNGLNLRVLKDGSMLAIATNGHQMKIARFGMKAELVEPDSNRHDEEARETEIILPRAFVTKMIKHLGKRGAKDEPVTLEAYLQGGDTGAAELRFGEFVVSFDSIQAKYPSYRRVIPKRIRSVELEQGALQDAWKQILAHPLVRKVTPGMKAWEMMQEELDTFGGDNQEWHKKGKLTDFDEVLKMVKEKDLTADSPPDREAVELRPIVVTGFQDKITIKMNAEPYKQDSRNPKHELGSGREAVDLPPVDVPLTKGPPAGSGQPGKDGSLWVVTLSSDYFKDLVVNAKDKPDGGKITWWFSNERSSQRFDWTRGGEPRIQIIMPVRNGTDGTFAYTKDDEWESDDPKKPNIYVDIGPVEGAAPEQETREARVRRNLKRQRGAVQVPEIDPEALRRRVEKAVAAVKEIMTPSATGVVRYPSADSEEIKELDAALDALTQALYGPGTSPDIFPDEWLARVLRDASGAKDETPALSRNLSMLNAFRQGTQAAGPAFYYAVAANPPPGMKVTDAGGRGGDDQADERAYYQALGVRAEWEMREVGPDEKIETEFETRGPGMAPDVPSDLRHKIIRGLSVLEKSLEKADIGADDIARGRDAMQSIQEGLDELLAHLQAHKGRYPPDLLWIVDSMKRIKKHLGDDQKTRPRLQALLKHLESHGLVRSRKAQPEGGGIVETRADPVWLEAKHLALDRLKRLEVSVDQALETMETVRKIIGEGDVDAGKIVGLIEAMKGPMRDYDERVEALSTAIDAVNAMTKSGRVPRTPKNRKWLADFEAKQDEMQKKLEQFHKEEEQLRIVIGAIDKKLAKDMIEEKLQDPALAKAARFRAAKRGDERRREMERARKRRAAAMRRASTTVSDPEDGTTTIAGGSGTTSAVGDGGRGPKMTRRQFLKATGASIISAAAPAGAGKGKRGWSAAEDWALVDHDEAVIYDLPGGDTAINQITADYHDGVVAVEHLPTGDWTLVPREAWDFDLNVPRDLGAVEDSMVEAFEQRAKSELEEQIAYEAIEAQRVREAASRDMTVSEPGERRWIVREEAPALDGPPEVTREKWGKRGEPFTHLKGQRLDGEALVADLRHSFDSTLLRVDVLRSDADRPVMDTTLAGLRARRDESAEFFMDEMGYWSKRPADVVLDIMDQMNALSSPFFGDTTRRTVYLFQEAWDRGLVDDAAVDDMLWQEDIMARAEAAYRRVRGYLRDIDDYPELAKAGQKVRPALTGDPLGDLISNLSSVIDELRKVAGADEQMIRAFETARDMFEAFRDIAADPARHDHGFGDIVNRVDVARNDATVEKWRNHPKNHFLYQDWELRARTEGPPDWKPEVRGLPAPDAAPSATGEDAQHNVEDEPEQQAVPEARPSPTYIDEQGKERYGPQHHMAGEEIKWPHHQRAVTYPEGPDKPFIDMREMPPTLVGVLEFLGMVPKEAKEGDGLLSFERAERLMNDLDDMRMFFSMMGKRITGYEYWTPEHIKHPFNREQHYGEEHLTLVEEFFEKVNSAWAGLYNILRVRLKDRPSTALSVVEKNPDWRKYFYEDPTWDDPDPEMVWERGSPMDMVFGQADPETEEEAEELAEAIREHEQKMADWPKVTFSLEMERKYDALHRKMFGFENPDSKSGVPAVHKDRDSRRENEAIAKAKTLLLGDGSVQLNRRNQPKLDEEDREMLAQTSQYATGQRGPTGVESSEFRPPWSKRLKTLEWQEGGIHIDPEALGKDIMGYLDPHLFRLYMGVEDMKKSLYRNRDEMADRRANWERHMEEWTGREGKKPHPRVLMDAYVFHEKHFTTDIDVDMHYAVYVLQEMWSRGLIDEEKVDNLLWQEDILSRISHVTGEAMWRVRDPNKIPGLVEAVKDVKPANTGNAVRDAATNMQAIADAMRRAGEPEHETLPFEMEAKLLLVLEEFARRPPLENIEWYGKLVGMSHDFRTFDEIDMALRDFRWHDVERFFNSQDTVDRWENHDANSFLHEDWMDRDTRENKPDWKRGAQPKMTPIDPETEARAAKAKTLLLGDDSGTTSSAGGQSTTVGGGETLSTGRPPSSTDVSGPIHLLAPGEAWVEGGTAYEEKPTRIPEGTRVQVHRNVKNTFLAYKARLQAARPGDPNYFFFSLYSQDPDKQWRMKTYARRFWLSGVKETIIPSEMSRAQDQNVKNVNSLAEGVLHYEKPRLGIALGPRRRIEVDPFKSDEKAGIQGYFFWFDRPAPWYQRAYQNFGTSPEEKRFVKQTTEIGVDWDNIALIEAAPDGMYAYEYAARAEANRPARPPRREQPNRLLPLFRWAGGKRKLAPMIGSKFPLDYKDYYEPFFGGGAVYLGQVAGSGHRAFLSDLDPDIVATWQAIRADPKGVEKAFDKLAKAHSKEFFLAVRKQDAGRMSLTNRAARFLYLMHTTFGGVWRKNKAGQFNSGMGEDKTGAFQRQRLGELSAAMGEARIKRQGYQEIQPTWGDVVYLDPPYDEGAGVYVVGRWGDAEQRQLARHAAQWRKRGATVIVSHSDTELIRSLYPEKDGWQHERVKAGRGIKSQKYVDELLMVGPPIVGVPLKDADLPPENVERKNEELSKIAEARKRREQ